MGVASGQFLNGFRQFQANLANVSATLRSRASIKSEDDLPPPYEAQISTDLDQQSPPPYHVAIAIEMTGDENSENTNYPENSNSDSNYPSSSHEDSEVDHDETDSKVNFAA